MLYNIILNYLLLISEQALQTMSIALRGDGQYELKGPAANIGWRIRKHYFLVCKNKNYLKIVEVLYSIKLLHVYIILNYTNKQNHADFLSGTVIKEKEVLVHCKKHYRTLPLIKK